MDLANNCAAGRRHKQLGFDADVLEIHLNELDAVIDRFFIIESTRTHNKVTTICIRPIPLT